MNFRFWKKPVHPDPPIDRFQESRMRAYLYRVASSVIRKSWISGYQSDPFAELKTQIQVMRTKEAEERRTAIATVNALYNLYGVIRDNFSQVDNDRLAENAIYGLCEKAVMDYVPSLDWEILDRKKERVESAISFLKKPNPQDTFSTLMKQAVRDLIRYDAAVWTLTRSIDNSILEIKSYLGPEFWIEIDRQYGKISGIEGQTYAGLFSHGYVKRYWQHARPGYFIPFDPEDICYFKMYPRSDSPYGTDFLSRLRYQLDTLIDSTKAAGMTFQNGFMPGIIWEHPELTSQEQLRERIIEAELENQGPDQFGGILHTIAGEKITPITPTLVDLQWQQGQKYLSQIVWAMFGFSETDFIGGSANRATAYIQRNITKSQMLYPLIKYFEEMINNHILPSLDGYEEGWEFHFIEALDIDDELKITQLESQKASVMQQYLMAGLPAKWALKLAKVGKDLSKRELQELHEAIEDNNQQQQGGFPPDMGGGGDETYMGTDTGAPGESDEDQPIQKARIIRKGRRSKGKNARLDIWLHC